MKFFKILFVNLLVLVFLCAGIFVAGELYLRTTMKFETEGATAVGLKIFKESDIYAWGHEPGAVDYHGYGKPTPEIRINSLGFRDDEIEVEKPSNVKRILVLGDSFTFGMGVRHEDIYTEVLEKILNERDDDFKYEVVDMGSIGYTIDNQYLILKEEGMRLDPDMVIVGFFAGNDLTEMRRHQWDVEDGDEEEEDGNKREKLVAIKDIKHYVDKEHRLRYYGEEEPNWYFLNFLKKRWIILEKKLGIYEDPVQEPTLAWPAFLEPDDPHGDSNLPEYWEKYEMLLEDMNEMVSGSGAELVVVGIPMDVQVSKKYWGKYAEMYFGDKEYEAMLPQVGMAELTNRVGVDFIDLLPKMQADQDAWYYYKKDDPHWTHEGHEFAAKVIYDNLKI